MKKLDLPNEIRPLWNLFEKLYLKFDAYTVLDDFLSAALNFFTPPGYDNFSVDVFNKYNKDERLILGKMINELIFIYHGQLSIHSWYDPLGDLYMFLSSRSKKSGLGQFFTPTSVVDLMIKMQYGSVRNSKNGLTVNDPTSGSGRFLIAFHANYPDNKMYAEDIDPICCKMTCLNMIVHGCIGEVVQHDALDPDDFQRAWRINPFLLNYRLPSIIPILQSDCKYYRAFEKKRKDTIPASKSIFEGKQLILFD